MIYDRRLYGHYLCVFVFHAAPWFETVFGKLEIASYGHKLRSIRNDTLSRQRRRAESIGHRESVVFDDEPDNAAPLVLDETPLTDMGVEEGRTARGEARSPN